MRMVWRIAGLTIDSPAVLAPMAGFTDGTFRRICKEQGCSLVCTPLVSAKAINFRNRKTQELLVFAGCERPIAIQLFGSSPAEMAQAAIYVAERARPDLIDINMGCPTPKVVDNGEGCALMRTPQLAAAIVAAVVAAVPLPVTVKIRKGWDAQHINAVEVARRVADAGAAAIAVHGRTRDQFYAGAADWNIVQAVKEAVSVPVIGNGDVRGPEDAARLMAESGCDAVMIGRAALGDPWIIQRVRAYLETESRVAGPTAAERVEMAASHLNRAVADSGPAALLEMRKHLAWYIKGLPGSHLVKNELMNADSYAQACAILHRYGAALRTGAE